MSYLLDLNLSIILLQNKIKTLFNMQESFWYHYLLWMEEVQKGFFGFPDQLDPENRVLPSWANPWAKRSPTTPQARRSVQPISQFDPDTTPID